VGKIMARDTKPQVAAPALEELEPRLALSTTLVREMFDSTALGALPSGWAQWSSTGTRSFAASTVRSLSGAASLASNQASNVNARAWVTSPQPADVQVSAFVFADSLAPVQILSRGSRLNTATPTYYALSVRRGLSLQLVRVVNGVATPLATLNSASWFTGSWVQVTLSVSGNRLRAQVYRPDTRQYLDPSGKWQYSAVHALDRTDSAISGAGQTGLARPASYSGTIAVDDFLVTGVPTSPTSGTTRTETFDRTVTGSLPSGWTQWSTTGARAFAASTNRALSGTSSLLSNQPSNVTARAWLTSYQPADIQVSTALFADSLAPIQVIARGSRLDSATPSYYAVAVRRGLTVQLVRVVNGVETTLGSLNSSSWFASQWVQVTLSVTGSRLRAQVYRPDTRQYLDASGKWQSSAVWALERSDTAITSGGLTGIARPSSYAGALYLDDFSYTPQAGTTPSPTIPRHYSHIRIAQLAYSGTPLGTFEDLLLRNSVDLVVTEVPYLNEHIARVSPRTPQLVYINYSSLYQELLTDWLAYADARGVSREQAFYHVTQATPFSGDSPSSQPVNWFWKVLRGGLSPDFKDVTSQAHFAGEDFVFGAAGESTYVGYPERFREINVSLVSGAASGWSATIEYPTAVDSFGNPTAWATLRTLSNTTAGLTRSGQILFDPPRDWKAASLGGSARLYYVRFRTVANGRAPVGNTLFGRDYVGARGTTRGTIPAFDAAADLDRDGYLNDAEYARRASGKNARFAYESRMFYGHYGQMRFGVNVSNAALRAWAVNYSQRYLASRPFASGLFVDNSIGSPLVDPQQVLEPVSSYAADYGSLLNAIGRAIAPRWILANTAGAGTRADAIVRQNTAYYEEFAIRPLSHNYRNFEDVAALIARRQALQSPSPYAILDSLPAGGSPTDPRTQIATLAYYYLLADPERTFLNFYGGFEPSTSWTRHWSPAVQYNVGRPLGGWSVFASGVDPNDLRYAYRVYQRSYSNALVLYKPLSSNIGAGSGTTSDNTATVHNLGAIYRPLRADGTLGAAVTRITLRNGEGAILVRA
jgi:hypothetical protein